MNGINKIDNQWIYKDNDYLIRSTNKDDVRQALSALKNFQEEETEEKEKTPEEMLDGLIQRAQELEKIENLDPEVIEELLDEVQELKEIMELDPDEQAERLDEIEEPDEDEKTIDDLLRTSDDETELEMRRKEENEDSTPGNTDERNELLRKRRMDPENAKFESEKYSIEHSTPLYSALEYKTADVDHYFNKLGYKVSSKSDAFLMELGCK